MITAERAIRTLRRDLTLGRLIRFGVGLGIAAVVVGSSAAGLGGAGFVVVLAVVVASGFVSVRLNRAGEAVADSPQLIAAGEFDQAEERIEQVLGTFWALRTAKLVGLHHLAVLRHAQRRWRESALLAKALLKLSRPGPVGRLVAGESVRQVAWLPPGLARTARLMLADSLIEMNDLAGAHEALGGLYAEKLSLAEAMNLLVIQLEYEARVGAWGSMLTNVGQKVQLAELLPAGPAARAQGLLALAAMRSGRAELAAWLRRRAELLADPAELVAQRPVLAEVFADPQEAGPAVGLDRTGTEAGA